jgi:hypothetical protein
MSLEREIRAFEARRLELEQRHHRKFVIFHDDDFIGAFDDFDSRRTPSAASIRSRPVPDSPSGSPD